MQITSLFSFDAAFVRELSKVLSSQAKKFQSIGHHINALKATFTSISSFDLMWKPCNVLFDFNNQFIV